MLKYNSIMGRLARSPGRRRAVACIMMIMYSSSLCAQTKIEIGRREPPSDDYRLGGHQSTVALLSYPYSNCAVVLRQAGNDDRILWDTPKPASLTLVRLLRAIWAQCIV
ncbi:hypothetical protein GQ53DRAFT_42606 [Thozetella sp. PMI_491]|nr:hypothetical protein GQ53DRAFT_42606 [Thozetella sp. PMI_491]